MPARTLRRPKAKKSKMKVFKRKKPARVTRKAKKKIAKKVVKRVAKRMIRRASKPSAPKIKALGKVVHYYDRIGVAIVELKAPLRLGDMVTIKRGTLDLLQSVTSLQIEHTPVASAKKGDVVGMKVSQEVHEGALVLPA